MRSISTTLRSFGLAAGLSATLIFAPLAAAPALAAPAPVSSLSSSACPELIKEGQNSGCVTRLQNLLNAHGAHLTADGDFGPKTLAAVKSFQSAHGLSADGIVGPKTKAALEAPTSQPPTGTTPAGTTQQKIVAYARDLVAGKAEPGWKGGKIPYSWGGGHGSKPGPTLGTCSGYTGSVKPCPADSTVGLDCSGFSRYVYSLAYGRDVLGAAGTNDQIHKVTKVTNPQPGDLIYYGTSSHTHHVAIYLGNGQIAEAPHTGANLEINPMSNHKDAIGYYRVG